MTYIYETESVGIDAQRHEETMGLIDETEDSRSTFKKRNEMTDE